MHGTTVNVLLHHINHMMSCAGIQAACTLGNQWRVIMDAAYGLDRTTPSLPDLKIRN